MNLVIIFFIFFVMLFCSPPSSPFQDPDNVYLKIEVPEKPGNFKYCVNETVNFKITVVLSNLVKRVSVFYDENGESSEQEITTNKTNKEEISFKFKYRKKGQKKVKFIITFRESSEERDTVFDIKIGVKPTIKNGKNLVALGDIELGKPISLAVEHEEFDKATYIWFKDLQLLQEKKKQSLIINPLKASDAGIYYCIVRTDWGQDTSKQFNLSFSGSIGPPKITKQPQNLTVKENENAPVSITVFTKVSAGFSHSMFLTTKGILWACGSNRNNELFDRAVESSSTPIQSMKLVKSMSAGEYYSLILKTDGALWACGANYKGQLGDGTINNRSTPVQIMDGVKSMVAGISHSLILKTDGTLWACGSNNSGQLGDGTTNNRSTPAQIMDDVKSMATGSDHSLILRTDGTLWTCGANEYGQIGDSTYDYSPTPIKLMNKVKSMSAGLGFSLILKTDGTLWVCGTNRDGQLGISEEAYKFAPGYNYRIKSPVQSMSDVKDISAGRSHSLILKTDGTLWGCGANFQGQLGMRTPDICSDPVLIMRGVRSMSAGGSHSLILKTDGTLLACGENSKGQLGDGTDVDSYTPRQIRFKNKIQ